MVAHNKYDIFSEDLVEGVHDFDAHSFRIILSNTAQTSAGTIRGSASEVSTGGGYTTNGNATTITTTRTGNSTKVVGTDPTAWTGSGGGFSARDAILCNDTPSSPLDPLVCYWTYGSSVTVLAGETFTVDLDGSNGMFALA